MLILAEVFEGSGFLSQLLDNSVQVRGQVFPWALSTAFAKHNLPLGQGCYPVLQGSSSAEPLPPWQPPLEHSGCVQVLDAVTRAGCGLSAPKSQ